MVDALQVSDFALEAIPPASKWKGWIHLGELPGGEQVRWPVLVVRGRQPGKVLLATAGTHGDEYEGMAAIHQFYRQLNPD